MGEQREFPLDTGARCPVSQNGDHIFYFERMLTALDLQSGQLIEGICVCGARVGIRFVSLDYTLEVLAG